MKTEIENLFDKTPEDRYTYFIENARTTLAVYVLYNQDKKEIALNIDKKNKSYVYLFPSEYSAELFLKSNSDMKQYKPHKWELDFFLNEAIKRLKRENTLATFVFPNPKGIGLNITFDKIIRDMSKTKEQSAFEEIIKKLLDYLDVNMESCNHDYALTKKFCLENNINFEDIVDWLNERGGYCDCEILANVEDFE
jgi:hypothetical protein